MRPHRSGAGRSSSHDFRPSLAQAREDPPLLAPLVARLDHRVAPLYVGSVLQAQAGQVHVGTFEHVGRGQHEVGQLGGGVSVQIDHDQQLERGEGVAQLLFAADRQQWVPGGHEERPHGLVRVTQVLGQQVAGQAALAQPAVWRIGEAVLVAAPSGLGVRVEAHRQHVAAASVQVAGHEGQHVHQPVGQGSLAAHVHARRHVNRGAWRVRELDCQLRDPLRRDPRDVRHPLGRVAAHEVA